LTLVVNHSVMLEKLIFKIIFTFSFRSSKFYPLTFLTYLYSLLWYLWRAVYTPGDGQTSPAYSSHSVQCLYINHLLSVNKPVLSYLLLRLLLQYNVIFLQNLQMTWKTSLLKILKIINNFSMKSLNRPFLFWIN
jgi:hypothetical protein